MASKRTYTKKELEKEMQLMSCEFVRIVMYNSQDTIY